MFNSAVANLKGSGDAVAIRLPGGFQVASGLVHKALLVIGVAISPIVQDDFVEIFESPIGVAGFFMLERDGI